MTADPLSGSFKIEGGKLVGDRFTFVPRDPGDKSPIYAGPTVGAVPPASYKAQ